MNEAVIYGGGLPVTEETLECPHCKTKTSSCEFVGDVCCVCFNLLTYRNRATADDTNWRERYDHRRLTGFTAFPQAPAVRPVKPAPPPPPPPKPRRSTAEVTGIGTGKYREAAQARMAERDDARLQEIVEALDGLLALPKMSNDERELARSLGREMEAIIARRQGSEEA